LDFILGRQSHFVGWVGSGTSTGTVVAVSETAVDGALGAGVVGVEDLPTEQPVSAKATRMQAIALGRLGT